MLGLLARKAQAGPGRVDRLHLEVDEDDARYGVVSRFGTGEFDGPWLSVAPVSGFVGGGGMG